MARPYQTPVTPDGARRMQGSRVLHSSPVFSAPTTLHDGIPRTGCNVRARILKSRRPRIIDSCQHLKNTHCRCFYNAIVLSLLYRHAGIVGHGGGHVFLDLFLQFWALLSHTHPQTHSHSHSHSPTHPLTHPPTHPPTHTHTLTHVGGAHLILNHFLQLRAHLSHTHPHPHSHSPTRPLTNTHTQTHRHTSRHAHSHIRTHFFTPTH